MSKHGKADQGLAKSRVLGSASLFRDAFSQKETTVGRCMVLWVRRGNDASLRLGVIASKKVSKSAVRRNRARRRLREVFRTHRACFSVRNVDILLVARGRIVDAEWDEVVADFTSVVSRAGLM